MTKQVGEEGRRGGEGNVSKGGVGTLIKCQRGKYVRRSMRRGRLRVRGIETPSIATSVMIYRENQKLVDEEDQIRRKIRNHVLLPILCALELVTAQLSDKPNAKPLSNNAPNQFSLSIIISISSMLIIATTTTSTALTLYPPLSLARRETPDHPPFLPLFPSASRPCLPSSFLPRRPFSD